MQEELARDHRDLAITILGVNGIDYASGNGTITAGRDIPWLQDVADPTSAWTLWQVAYRDVIVVGPDGDAVDVYNLTTHDLGLPANYAELRDILIDAAMVPEPSSRGLALASLVTLARLRAMRRRGRASRTCTGVLAGSGPSYALARRTCEHWLRTRRSTS